MKYKCEYNYRCKEWEQDSLRCSIFYKFCKDYKEFKFEEQEYARQLKIAKQRDKTYWNELEDLASENEGRIISRWKI